MAFQSIDFQIFYIVISNKRTVLVTKIHQVKIMDKAKDFEEFIKGIANGINIGCCVRYDLASLEYGELHQHELEEYGEYVDIDEIPNDIEDELRDWEIDVVMYLREICDLPKQIESPRIGEQIDWMVDFANNRISGKKFIKDVQRAIDSSHPFGAFKQAVAHYGLLNDWYRYRDVRYMDYVRRKLGLK